MKSAKFIIFRNSRLEFNQSFIVVENFIRDRLKFAGIQGIDFVDDFDIAINRANDLISEASAGYIVIMDVMNPMVDLQLVDAMIRCLQRNDALIATCEGAVPGSQVEYVLDSSKLTEFPYDLIENSESEFVVHKRWDSQRKHNNQFNLYKYKRLKLFLKILESLDRMHKMSKDEF